MSEAPVGDSWLQVLVWTCCSILGLACSQRVNLLFRPSHLQLFKFYLRRNSIYVPLNSMSVWVGAGITCSFISLIQQITEPWVHCWLSWLQDGIQLSSRGRPGLVLKLASGATDIIKIKSWLLLVSIVKSAPSFLSAHLPLCWGARDCQK
jgi:hypothetical protein